MLYQIIPLEMGSIVEREIYRKSNMEIKCGLVWKLGSVITPHKPTFLKTYNPAVGICLEDLKGAEISDTYNGEKVIYFSETVPEDLQEELTDIFYGISRKYSGPHQAVFEDLDWSLEKVESFIFGQLEAKELKEEDLAAYK